jgi:hypothetical protein
MMATLSGFATLVLKVFVLRAPRQLHRIVVLHGYCLKGGAAK